MKKEFILAVEWKERKGERKKKKEFFPTTTKYNLRQITIYKIFFIQKLKKRKQRFVICFFEFLNITNLYAVIVSHGINHAAVFTDYDLCTKFVIFL